MIQNLTHNQRFFLFINTHVGKNKVCDASMIFFARWLIYILAGLLAYYVWRVFPPVVARNVLLGVGRLAMVGFFFNWVFGFVFPHPRPQVELEKMTLLVHPHQTFKSFPSDHATLAVIFATIGILMTYQVSVFLAVLFGVMGALVAIARVYVGVHYPRDIVGGFLFALGYVWLFWGFIETAIL